jgi:hypothetical protein
MFLFLSYCMICSSLIAGENPFQCARALQPANAIACSSSPVIRKLNGVHLSRELSRTSRAMKHWAFGRPGRPKANRSRLLSPSGARIFRRAGIEVAVAYFLSHHHLTRNRVAISQIVTVRGVPLVAPAWLTLLFGASGGICASARVYSLFRECHAPAS